MTIHIKRVYEPAESSDGVRILVDRLWPRGIKKTGLKIDKWVKDVAPSPALRKWYDHEPAKWKTFSKQYMLELRENPAVEDLLVQAGTEKVLTLIYAASDENHNHAIVLREFLENAVSGSKK